MFSMFMLVKNIVCCGFGVGLLFGVVFDEGWIIGIRFYWL